MAAEEFVRTGVPGVDELLAGKGIPQGYIVFVLGSPGSGKTIFGLQYLYEGVKRFNQNGVYISLDENVDILKANARHLGMDLDSLEREGKLTLVDASPIRRVPGPIVVGDFRIGKREFTLVALMDIIKTHIKKVGAKRLVIDPLVSLTLQLPDEVERRTALLDVMQTIAETGCTALLITELSESGMDRRYQFEEFLAQGVVILRKLQRPGGVVRIFHVEKMRGISHDDQPHPYNILEKGITVYPSELAFQSRELS